MLLNLLAEMARARVSVNDLAALWHCHRNTVARKIAGTSSIKIEEAYLARATYFPHCSLDYLFDTHEQAS